MADSRQVQTNYELTVKECSRLLRVLYNSSVLKPEASEYALQLLPQSGFKTGFSKYMDPSLKIARKFGERILREIQQLHETGIFTTTTDPCFNRHDQRP
ncbi:MAG: serine hydrolase [Bacteroidetes bacterium]|nr:serine hydrolase [Bacteroidota bacterium]